MGYGHAPDAVGTTIKTDLNWGWQWWTLVVWFVVGLGFRISGFRWISKPLRDPISALVLATVVGFLLFFLLVQFPHEEQIYGVIYLQCIFSIFAFSRLTFGWWRGGERSQWAGEWLRLATKGMITLVTCAVLVRIVTFAVHSPEKIGGIRSQFLPCFLLILLLVGTSAFMKRSHRFSTAGSAMLMGVLLIGFTAWIAPLLNFGMGRMQMDVTLGPGEVQGLNRLAGLAAPGERFATNKHNMDTIATHPERSYGYSALAGHPVLLEGYFYHTPIESPEVKSLLRTNDLMFTTNDPETVREIARTWSVRWLVARPGTDISLPRPLPAWLVEQQNSGDLKIYRID
jgi:hypothetical protein